MRPLVWLLLAAALPVSAHTVVLYSRADAEQANRVHVLAQAFGPALIDRQLPAGATWRSTIAATICAADKALLVWSARAAQSVEVRRELDTALMCRVLVVPVLLDSTPLPGLIGDTQGVDWRASTLK